MTQIRLDEPTDEQTFQHGLVDYLKVATENDLAIERAWKCRDGGNAGWEIEIVRLVSEEGAE